MQLLHSWNRLDSLNKHKVAERKLWNHHFTTRKQPVTQGSLKQGQSPGEHSAHTWQCVWKSILSCRYLQHGQQHYQPDTHTQDFPLSQEYLPGLSAPSAQAQPQTSEFRANRVSFHWTPSQYSHDLSRSVWGSAKHAKYETLHCPFFLLSGCF